MVSSSPINVTNWVVSHGLATHWAPSDSARLRLELSQIAEAIRQVGATVSIADDGSLLVQQNDVELEIGLATGPNVRVEAGELAERLHNSSMASFAKRLEVRARAETTRSTSAVVCNSIRRGRPRVEF